MARSRDVPSKKPSWSLFAAKKSEAENAAKRKSEKDAGSGGVKKSKKTAVVVEKTPKVVAEPEKKKKKKRRFKSAVVSKREINKAQKHGNAGFATGPTDRLIREITSELGFEASRFEPRAIRALIEATEQFTIDYLRLTDVLCAHARRITLSKKDSDLASTLLLGNHLFQEENGSIKARLGVLKAMRRDSVSTKNDEKLVPSRERGGRDAGDAGDDEVDDEKTDRTVDEGDDADAEDDADDDALAEDDAGKA